MRWNVMRETCRVAVAHHVGRHHAKALIEQHGHLVSPAKGKIGPSVQLGEQQKSVGIFGSTASRYFYQEDGGNGATVLRKTDVAGIIMTIERQPLQSHSHVAKDGAHGWQDAKIATTQRRVNTRT